MPRQKGGSALYRVEPGELRQQIIAALYAERGNVASAARRMGCTRAYLWHWIKRLGIERVPESLRLRARTWFRLTA